ncbi:hypothetical protein BDR03DRAFT_955299 [Suillus americanus]|nr:hypothetical protein BDR03DRAFT_955299 [Suillus americanus]
MIGRSLRDNKHQTYIIIYSSAMYSGCWGYSTFRCSSVHDARPPKNIFVVLLNTHIPDKKRSRSTFGNVYGSRTCALTPHTMLLITVNAQATHILNILKYRITHHICKQTCMFSYSKFPGHRTCPCGCFRDGRRTKMSIRKAEIMDVPSLLAYRGR